MAPGDLVDARGVAEVLGLAPRESVSLYQRRYPSMPRPVLDLGSGRPRLWSRSSIEAWAASRRETDERPASRNPHQPEALLDATERLATTALPSEITMRRIAQEAGCSVGLAYRYFSGKEELIGATLERIGEQLSRSARGGRTPRQQLRDLSEALEAHPAFHRLMTWLVLEGHDVARIMSRHPVIGDVTAEAMATRSGDPALRAGMLAFCALSLQGYGSLVNRAMGRPAGDERLHAAVADMYAAWADADEAGPHPASA